MFNNFILLIFKWLILLYKNLSQIVIFYFVNVYNIEYIFYKRQVYVVLFSFSYPTRNKTQIKNIPDSNLDSITPQMLYRFILIIFAS